MTTALTIDDLRIEDDDAVPEGNGLMRVLDRSGDSRFSWDPAKPEEVELARQQYESLKGKRYLAYKVTRAGGRGETVHEFDPSVRELIMAPQTVGG